MKKILIPMLLLFVLVGCGKNQLARFDVANSNMKKLDNYHLSLKASAVNDSYSLSTIYEADMDQKNKISKIDNTMTISDYTYSIVSYNDYNNKTSYINDNNIWRKSGIYVLDNFDFSALESPTSEEKTETGYKITINGDNINKIVSMLQLDATMDTSDLIFNVTVDNKYITKIELAIPITNDQYTGDLDLVFEFSKFNEVGNVTISDEALKAYDENTAEILNSILMYYYEVDFNIYSNSLVNGTFTDTTLTYDGKAPSKVSINYANGIITDGVIELDGYRGVITNGKIENYEAIE